MAGTLPREGLTLEALVAPFRLTALQPLLTGPLLLVLYRYPKLLAKAVPAGALQQLRSARSITALSALFAFGLLRKVNKTLSKLVLNNFTTDKSWDWSKEIIVITGGSGGIGGLMTQMFAKQDITVIVLDISPPSFLSNFPCVHFYQADITSSEKIHAVAETIRAEHGEPTVLINNAGIGTNKNILDETEAEMRRVFDVNIIAHFLLVKEFSPAMIKRNHGHIVTIASMASFMVHAQNVDYTCTKAGALAFHEGLAQELKSRYNADMVRTTIVHPTWVRTPLIASLIAKNDFTEFTLEPETVAAAVVKQVLSGYGAQLVLPGRFTLVPLIRGMPSWLQEFMRNGVANVIKT
ncbi:Dehydrogenase [Lachnellula suecica]|uniref:Short-chain dehydrogenase/reductase 3 n=1 Tax=Lachnellula suecica TaxID=602035 RepID=A0A8T9CJ74_9HELO|nr:Dehydrogenase [Lachnellula suecica]